MFTAMLGEQGGEFGFDPADRTNWAIIERQNGAPMPDEQTVLTFRIDDYNLWGGQRRHISSGGYYDKYGNEVIHELRTFVCVVNVMSKGLGDAFDSARFIIANLQNNRYNDFVEQKGRLLGIENISTLENLSNLENGTWTERVYFEIKMNFREEITVSSQTLFVKKPETLGDLTQSVEVEIKTKI